MKLNNGDVLDGVYAFFPPGSNELPAPSNGRIWLVQLRSGAYALGLSVGPGLGGLLADPTEHLPSLFGSSHLLDR